MVRRPVFVPDSARPYVSELSLDFEQFSGSSIQQKQRSIASLHASMWLSFLRRAFWRCRPRVKETLAFS